MLKTYWTASRWDVGMAIAIAKSPETPRTLIVHRIDMSTVLIKFHLRAGCVHHALALHYAHASFHSAAMYTAGGRVRFIPMLPGILQPNCSRV